MALNIKLTTLRSYLTNEETKKLLFLFGDTINVADLLTVKSMLLVTNNAHVYAEIVMKLQNADHNVTAQNQAFCNGFIFGLKHGRTDNLLPYTCAKDLCDAFCLFESVQE